MTGIAGKVIFEAVAGRSIYDTLDGIPVVVSVTSHAAGAVTALIFYLTLKPTKGDRF
jgi:hypothetical protein